MHLFVFLQRVQFVCLISTLHAWNCGSGRKAMSVAVEGKIFSSSSITSCSSVVRALVCHCASLVDQVQILALRVRGNPSRRCLLSQFSAVTMEHKCPPLGRVSSPEAICPPCPALGAFALPQRGARIDLSRL